MRKNKKLFDTGFGVKPTKDTAPLKLARLNPQKIKQVRGYTLFKGDKILKTVDNYSYLVYCIYTNKREAISMMRLLNESRGRGMEIRMIETVIFEQ